MSNIKILDWDSQFFGFKVASFSPENLSENEFKQSIKKMKLNGITLVYGFVNVDDQRIEQIFKQCGGYLVSTNITFQRLIDDSKQKFKVTQNIKITEYKDRTPTSSMYELSIQSGIYSRFKIDPKIKLNKFYELYKRWILNSVNKKIADVVYVARQHDDIVGMITLNKNGEMGEIGLIAVSPHVRGMGVGKALIQTSLLRFRREGCKFIQVVTQKNNVSAVRLYKHSGFHIKDMTAIYHLWLQ